MKSAQAKKSDARSEADARVNIDAMLANAGWRADQIRREIPKHEDQKKALNGLKPDYMIYSDGERKPVMIIEAKRAKSNLRKAIEQALKYGKKMGCKIVFASDGNVVASARVGEKGPLLMQDSEVTWILPERHLINFKDSRRWERGEGFSSSADLVKLFNSARTILNKVGIAHIEAFNEFGKLIFVKILTELHDQGEGMFKDIPSKWSDFSDKSGDDLICEYGTSLAALNKRYAGGFSETEIVDSKILEELIGLLNGRSFIDTDADIKGAAYEYFLRDYTKTKDELNRYFTPRHIVAMMVKHINPQNGEKIYDPFCGTGGMLIEAFRHMQDRLPTGEKYKKSLSNLQKHTLYGKDISNTASVAKMNMILAGDGHSNIEKGDSTKSVKKGKYDVVLTNIPFAGGERECGYIRCCLDSVRGRPDGRAAIIVPERIVSENQYSALRKEILSEWNVDRVVSLPRDVFGEYTQAKTSVLFVSWRGDRGIQKSVPVLKIINDGLEGKTRRKPHSDGLNDISSMFMGELESREMILSEPALAFNYTGAAAIKARNKYRVVKVGDIISYLARPVTIEPGMICLELGFKGKEHRIFINKRKRYSQVAASGRKRNAIRKGDLVIATAHVEDGLIAFSECEEELHATGSHSPFSINEKLVDKRYLFWTLRGILMTLEIVDTVGRATLRKDQVLDLPFPLPTMAKQREIGSAMDKARQEIWDAEIALKKATSVFNETERRIRSFDIM